LHLWPLLTNLTDDTLQLFNAAGRGVDVRGTQPGTKQMLAAEDVQRQVAVVLVVPMKEPPRLVPVDQIVRGIQIQHDAPGWKSVGLQEDLGEEPLDRTPIQGDLLVAALRTRPDRCEFQPVQGALAGQRLAAILRTTAVAPKRILLASQDGQQGIVSQIVVVVEVLVAEGEGVDALGDQFIHGVLNPIGVAVIGEAGRELGDDPGDPLRLSQQQSAAVRRDMPTVESSHNITPPEGVKSERLLVTLCRHQAVPP